MFNATVAGTTRKFFKSTCVKNTAAGSRFDVNEVEWGSCRNTRVSEIVICILVWINNLGVVNMIKLSAKTFLLLVKKSSKSMKRQKILCQEGGM